MDSEYPDDLEAPEDEEPLVAVSKVERIRPAGNAEPLLEGIVFVSQIIERAIQQTIDVVYSKHIDSMLIPYSFEMMMRDIRQTVAFQNIGHDPGETAETLTKNWTLSHELVNKTFSLIIGST